MTGPVRMVEVLVTGGAGFIGSNFVRYTLKHSDDCHITTLDKLTYAGRRENLHDVIDHPRHTFVQGDITDASVTKNLVEKATIVVHFAAETHVDRSIQAADDFIQTDVVGTFVLLEAARRAPNLNRFVTDTLLPRNPYSASKAAADRLAYSYWATYNVPVIITRASNNYGPYQYPEKMIPLFATNAIDHLKVPLYGDGHNIRDWLHVEDHCRALELLIDKGLNGQVYNIGGGNEIANINLTHQILKELHRPDSLIKPVSDRAGHDHRYALNTNKLRNLSWSPQIPFNKGLHSTLEWYTKNEWWWRPIKEQDEKFRSYYKDQYERDQ